MPSEKQPKLTLDEKTRRLRSMLVRIAGEHGLESINTDGVLGRTGLEAIESPRVLEAAGIGLENLKTGRSIAAEEAAGLEAIVLPKLRPVAFIRRGKYDDLTMDIWGHLNSQETRDRLEPLFQSIGRVEVPLRSDIPYGGTGFVVGPNLLMTNRHVARLFADGLGTRLTYHAGGSALDFQRERDSLIPDPSMLVRVTQVVMIHPYWDMALLKVAGLPETAKPLKLSVQPPEDFVGRDVVIVGYPAQDYRNDLDVQNRIFENIYGVKRLQPGKGNKRGRIQSFENIVDAMTHDASTLGGNSGSVVIHVASGTIIGLHFAGEYLKANYAVPTYELARDKRVTALGLNFAGQVPSTTAWSNAWMRADAGGETLASTPDTSTSPPTNTQAPASPAVASARFDFPMSVTVTIGAPTVAAVPAPAVLPPRADVVPVAAVEKVPVMFPDLQNRVGYEEGFLEFEDETLVPMPELTDAGKAIVATIEDGSQVLNYHRFSVVVHKRRRLALFTAANVDWRRESHLIDGKKPSRTQLNGFDGSETWVVDPRIPFDHQLPDYFYTKDGQAFDKGHLVRRDDVAWGESFEDMQMANGDTFHTTNCSPQIAVFNQADKGEFNWGDLENMVQQQTKTERVCVFSGPVLDDSDQYFHGLIKSGVEVSLQIPSRFWKIIVANNDGSPAAFGFVLDQDLSDVDLHAEMAVPNEWKKFLCPISEIEGYLNGLATLPALIAWDQYGK